MWTRPPFLELWLYALSSHWVNAYSKPSLLITDVAVSVVLPRNHGAGVQLTSVKSVVTVTVIMSPARAVAGFGETVTVTPDTDAPDA